MSFGQYLQDKEHCSLLSAFLSMAAAVIYFAKIFLIYCQNLKGGNNQPSDLTALLDATDPEPLPAGSPLWTLPNAHISSYIAGAIRDEIERLTDTILEEFDAWRYGRPLRYAITLPMLETMG